MEPRGCNRWQPVANRITRQTAQTSQNRCRALRPVAVSHRGRSPQMPPVLKRHEDQHLAGVGERGDACAGDNRDTRKLSPTTSHSPVWIPARISASRSRSDESNLDALEQAGHIEFLLAPRQPREDEKRPEQRRSEQIRRGEIRPDQSSSLDECLVEGNRRCGAEPRIPSASGLDDEPRFVSSQIDDDIPF